jgi:dihydrodipicolinate synthase/N-acetylneuraminate lyase
LSPPATWPEGRPWPPRRLPLPIKTRTKEVGFQVLTGSASILLDALEAGASGAILGFAACAPQACQEVYLAWKDHDLKLAAEKQAAHCRPRQAHRRPTRHQRRQARLRLQRLLRRASALAIASSECTRKGGD